MTRNMRKRRKREKWNLRMRWLDNTVLVCLMLIIGTGLLMAVTIWTMWPWIRVVAG